MATLVLQAVGGIVGGFLGPVGAAIGTAAGAMAGYWVDQSLFGPGARKVEGARLTTQRAMTAEEGTPIARVYGYGRVAGTVIWATRFEEERRTERQGGKGGPRGTTVTSYSYFGNVAIAVADGPVAMVKRVWADGRELDLTEIDWRFYDGSENQQPDPLILAKQGDGNAPAYRGLAYIVFERLPLEQFGNRIPQLQVEVIRPVGDLEKDVRAITVIPGSTEHGYAPNAVTSRKGPGETVEFTRHVLHADNDWTASIDELQAVCPNLEHVALVVAWFGDDLRAGHCTIRPGVTDRDQGLENPSWRVAGLARSHPDIRLVSRIDGRSAYGGSPSDASVIAAIADLNARGLKVTLHPFVMMDVPADNGLDDPYGADSQSSYPWRGRITCHPAAGRPGTADRTAGAAAQIDAFMGADDGWGYRRFVLHLAALANAAGGIDAMLLGSELRGLTRVRDDNDAFVFVAALRTLAADVRSVLGATCKLTYGADWSEYFGYHPQDGSGDVYYHLDPLWADDNIDAIGIDNYMPLADWREDDAASMAEQPDGFSSEHDSAAMQSQIAAGEGFEWYYASYQDRLDRVRTPITDGAYDKPWVWRYKDLVGWWSNQHHDRVGGVEVAQASAWVPRSKPIWFTELGCGAVHAGANQPNAFTDPKSSESTRPYHSSGTRSDATQRAFLEAHHRHWNAVGTDQNPLADDLVTAMLDPGRMYLWAWDARPFPAFPRNTGVWGDGENWLTGHWLNGRLGSAPLAQTLLTLFAEHQLPPPDVGDVTDVAQGLVVDAPASARAIMEPIAQAFGLHAIDTGETEGLGVRLVGHPYRPIIVPRDLLCRMEGHGDRHFVTGQADELPREVIVRYRDAIADYIAGSARSRRGAKDNARLVDLNLPCAIGGDAAAHLADGLLDRIWTGRDRARCQLPLRFAGIEPGDVIAFDDAPARHWRVDGVEVTDRLDLALVSVAPALPNRRRPFLPGHPAPAGARGLFGGPPEVAVMDLPLLNAATPQDNARVALFAVPDGPYAILVSPGEDGFEQRGTVAGNAVMGELTEQLAAGPPGRYDHANTVSLQLYGGALASAYEALVLGGRNALAVEKPDGLLEVLQFTHAEEIAPDRWLLRVLLRGQAGTEDAAATVADIGARVVLLDERASALGLARAEVGLSLNWRFGPIGKPFSQRYFTTRQETLGLRALTPYAPVHLRAARTADDGLSLSWTRRTRIDGDNWDGVEVALGEETEAYALELRGASDSLIFAAQCAAPVHVIDPVTVQAIYGGVPATVDMRVSQISTRVGPGIVAAASVAVSG